MVIWLIGKSGSGKTYFGEHLYHKIKVNHSNIVLLDGDLLRNTISKDLGHTKEDRFISEERRSYLSKILSDQGIHVIISGLSNEIKIRKWNKENIIDYVEIYIRASQETLHNRDPKGIYKRYSEGEINNVVGEDIKFNEPLDPWMTIDNNNNSNDIKKTIDSIILNLINSNILH